MPGIRGVDGDQVCRHHRYFEAIDKASDRVSMWKIGQSEEWTHMILVAIADESTIKSLDKYKAQNRALTDPRKTTEEQHSNCWKTASDLLPDERQHSPETGDRDAHGARLPSRGRRDAVQSRPSATT